MTVNEVLAQARNENRTVLTEIEAKRVLGAAGIACVETRLAVTSAEAVALSERIGYPVVLKVSSVDITHKSDAGGVKLNLQDQAAVAGAFDDIIVSCRRAFPKARIEGVSVQGMVKPGIEIIMGMIKDAKFGPVIMFGLGGVLVEVLEDVAFRIVPLDRRDAAEMVGEIKGSRLLQGYRGHEAANIPSLENMLLRLAAFADATPEVREIDMNPVLARADGAVVADARIILES